MALAFILPSFLMTVAIGWLYVRFGGLGWMQAAFYGVGATVIAIISLAAWKLAKLTLAKDRLQWVIFAVMGVVTAWTETEIGTLFVLAGVVTLLVQAPPAFLRRPRSACLAVALTRSAWPAPVVLHQGGRLRLGSGLAIVPFLSGASCRNTAGSPTSSSSTLWRSPC